MNLLLVLLLEIVVAQVPHSEFIDVRVHLVGHFFVLLELGHVGVHAKGV